MLLLLLIQQLVHLHNFLHALQQLTPNTSTLSEYIKKFSNNNLHRNTEIFSMYCFMANVIIILIIAFYIYVRSTATAGSHSL